MSDTVLVLKAEETAGLVGMDEAIQLMEEAYRDYGHNLAKVIHRRRIEVPLAGRKEPTWFWLNVIPGAVPCHNSAAIRVAGRHYSYPSEAGQTRVRSLGTGLVLVWDMESRKLLGIVQDGIISPLRVGATSGVAAKYLARKDATTLGVIGSGQQAVGQVAALLSVRPGIRSIKAYSLRQESRERFAEKLRRRYKVEVETVTSAEAAVRGSEVVVCATTSADPVLKGAWLEEGAHVIGMIGTDYFDRRCDVDEFVGQRADIVVVNSRDQVRQDLQPEIMDPIRRGYLTWEHVHELGELCIGKVAGRIGASQVTFHSNNAGMGIQFASICKRAIEVARERRIGTELPGDLFSSSKYQIDADQDEETGALVI